MKSISIIAILIGACCVNYNAADNLTVGNVVGASLAYLENVKLSAIPYTVREKNVFYSSEKNQVIKAITAKDMIDSKAKATVTAGGAGSTFVNIKMKSERGKALNYQVLVFV